MQVVCKDGTSIQCQHFRAIDSGVLLFEESPGDEGSDDEEEAFEEATGFVPITELRFVLPDEAARARAGAQRAGQAERGGPGGAPSHGRPPLGGPTAPAGRPPQQQGMGRQQRGRQQGSGQQRSGQHQSGQQQSGQWRSRQQPASGGRPSQNPGGR